MSLADVLQVSRELADRIARTAQGVQFPASDRSRLSAALMDQVHEHHESIRLLLENDLVGSAFALVRITFETAVRGIWLFRCASDDEVGQFKADRLEKRFGELIAAVEASVGAPGTALSQAKRRFWGPMCSYAHGGYLQAVRRISATEIGPNYSEEERIGVLSFADFCLLLVSVELCSLAGRDDLANDIAQFPI
jgi:hypothetical protein